MAPSPARSGGTPPVFAAARQALLAGASSTGCTRVPGE